MLIRRKIRSTHDALVACQELAQYLNPFPPDAKYDEKWFEEVKNLAGIKASGEDVPLTLLIELYCYLHSQVTDIFEEMCALHEEQRRRA